MTIPTKEECLSILSKNNTPSNVIEHCKAVCRVAEDTAEKLMKRGVKVNKGLVTASALLHDIERAKKNHVIEGAKLLKKMGFQEVSEVVRKHSLYKLDEPDSTPKTVEEKIVFYADKRVAENKIVGLEERFDALEKNYGVKLSKELLFTKEIEKELIGK